MINASWEKTVTLAGRSFTLCGNPDDPYFNTIEAVASDVAPLRAWVRQNLPDDAVVIDAGANIGLTTLLLSALLPNGKVHAFEANPANAEFLQANIALNGMSNCVVNAVAVGAEPGRIAMQGGGSSSHVTMSRVAGEVAAGGTIPMITLDQYARENCIDRLDFIKIDVEGFEPAVLDGARQLIETHRSPILMEFNSWCLQFVQGYSARDLAASLWDAFDIASVDVAGAEYAAGNGSMMRFLHDNVVLHGTIEDVLLHLKPGRSVPRQGATAPPLPDHETVEALAKARSELRAIHQSTSWRVTAPLRAFKKHMLMRSFSRSGGATSSDAAPRG